MSADSLLAHLEAVRKTGPYRWRARCPVCGGKNANKLAVRERGDGCVLIFCFGCGAKGPAVCNAIGVDPADLFPDRVADDKRQPRERRPFESDDALRIIDYEISDAALLIAVCSKHPEQLTVERRNRLMRSAHTIRQARAACGLREVSA